MTYPSPIPAPLVTVGSASMRSANSFMSVECPLCDGDGCQTCGESGIVEEGGFVDEIFRDSDRQVDDITNIDDSHDGTLNTMD